MNSNVNSIVRRSVSCYFCNEFFEERYLPEHVKHCCAVLEECPKKCGAYVPRRNMEAHLRQCVEKKVRNIHPLETQNQTQSDLLWRDKIFSILSLLRSAVDGSERERKRLEEAVTLSMKNIERKHADMEILRLSVLEDTERVRQDSVIFEQRLLALERIFNEIDQHTNFSFKQVAEQLDFIQTELAADRNKCGEMINEWQTELKGFKTFLAKESVMISGMWHEQLEKMHDMKLELEMRCKGSRELTEKHDILSEKIDILVREMRNHSEAITNQAKEIKTLKFQMKDNVKYVEDLIKDSLIQSKLQDSDENDVSKHTEQISTNGRLLWRIDRYKEKMTDAKENDTVLRSPIFYNKDYGYTLRVELFLNGRGQWKDRHIIGCLRVIDGKWDPLLDWPCVLQATVTLRDQENPANDIRKIVKVTKKLKDGDSQKPDNESGLYMFIPHTKLTRYPGYVKDNVLFLDIQTRDLKIGGSTPSLIS
ncbi:TNF receptor-associated factor 5 isoform X1 [Cephus cinctus]|uniref:TNF receptor-associated factor 5 isoform X1 n=2 Tax=Cephus cinctus TaxID=211228 RepID=A0AAJ7RKX2_CEPCN|nr:TNF receptor-associated factor 5 isoform X1 [Cephus cinctus]